MAMKCASCGTANPEGYLICNKCGSLLDSVAPSQGSSGSRNCVSCGRAIQFEANVCPYCGHDYRIAMAPVQQQQAISGGMRILFYILSLIIPLVGFIIGAIYYMRPDPESKHIGKICIVLAIVGILITVGLATVLYVMTLGFSSVTPGVPTSSLTKTTVDYGVKCTFVSMSYNTVWSDVTIVLQESNGNAATWYPVTADLDGGNVAQKIFAPVSLGPIANVWCNVTDLAGNGNVNQGDYFTLTTGSVASFSSSTTYTVTIIHKPTTSAICHLTFNG